MILCENCAHLSKVKLDIDEWFKKHRYCTLRDKWVYMYGTCYKGDKGKEVDDNGRCDKTED